MNNLTTIALAVAIAYAGYKFGSKVFGPLGL